MNCMLCVSANVEGSRWVQAMWERGGVQSGCQEAATCRIVRLNRYTWGYQYLSRLTVQSSLQQQYTYSLYLLCRALLCFKCVQDDMRQLQATDRTIPAKFYRYAICKHDQLHLHFSWAQDEIQQTSKADMADTASPGCCKRPYSDPKISPVQQ